MLEWYLQTSFRSVIYHYATSDREASADVAVNTIKFDFLAAENLSKVFK